MSRTFVSQDPLIDAVIAAIASLGFAVGDHEAPENPAPAFPYSVVYSLPDALYDGPMNDHQADVWHNVQVTTVGQTREQASMLQDKIRAKLIETDPIPITINFREVSLVELVEGGTVERDDEEQPRLFYSIDIWQIITTETGGL